MNDRELADIGVKREDIARYAMGHAGAASEQVTLTMLNGWSPSAAKVSNDYDQNLAA